MKGYVWSLLHPFEPLEAAVSSLYFFQALEDRVTTIEPFHLSFVDSESPTEKIVFNVTVPLPPNQGKILNKPDS